MSEYDVKAQFETAWNNDMIRWDKRLNWLEKMFFSYTRVFSKKRSLNWYVIGSTDGLAQANKLLQASSLHQEVKE